MHLVEKIGQLVLVTLEGKILDKDIQRIRDQLVEITKNEDEAVVSLNLSNLDGSHLPQKNQIKDRYLEIIDFCNESNIRIYSYIYE